MKKFEKFKKRHQLSNNDIAKIANEYAYTPQDFARSYFSEKYEISPSVFYSIRDWAIIANLVDDKTVKRIQNKAKKNSISNGSEKGSSSKKHFEKLLVERHKFLCSFSQEDLIAIGEMYSNGINLHDIAIDYNICTEAIKKLLYRGFVNFIFPLDLMVKISETAPGNMQIIRDECKFDEIIAVLKNNQLQKLLHNENFINISEEIDVIIEKLSLI